MCRVNANKQFNSKEVVNVFLYPFFYICLCNIHFIVFKIVSFDYISILNIKILYSLLFICTTAILLLTQIILSVSMAFHSFIMEQVNNQNDLHHASTISINAISYSRLLIRTTIAVSTIYILQQSAHVSLFIFAGDYSFQY